MKKYFWVALVATAFLNCSLNADVIFVDADVNSNTTLADGTAMVDGVHYLVDNVTSDGLWDVRSFGNNATVISSNNAGGSNEDAPELRTTISGLVSGETYEIFTYFWGSTRSWRGRTGLASAGGSLPGYNTNHFAGSSYDPMSWITNNVSGGDNPQTTFTFDSSAMTEEGGRALYEVHLGQVLADVNGEIQVFIDDHPNTNSNNRTWYDGVGYQISSVPEPSSALALTCVLGVAISRRRRKSS